MIDASVIVLAWNGMAHLGACLDSLLALRPQAKELIVVDNGSTDGSGDFVRAKYPAIRLICNTRNLGFSAGMNAGLRSATGDMLVLLNQDTIVSHSWLGEMDIVLQSDQRIAIVGGKALYPDGRIQHAGGFVDARGEGVHWGYGQVDSGAFDSLQDVDYVTGAALALPRKYYAVIGELDEDFAQAYFEDVDWCYRARTAGGRIVYAPKAEYIHKEVSSAGGASYQTLYMKHRNRLRFVLKNFTAPTICGQFKDAEAAWLRSLANLETWRLPALHRAYFYTLSHLNSILQARERFHETSDAERQAVTETLIELRSVVPVPCDLTSAFDTVAARARAPVKNNPASHESHTRSVRVDPDTLQIRPHRFQSTIPVIGQFVAAFRRLWNTVSAEWSVSGVILQQNAINQILWKQLYSLLERVYNLEEAYGLTHQPGQEQLTEMALTQKYLEQVECAIEHLTEYAAENGREIVDLTAAIRELRSSPSPEKQGSSS